MVDDYKRKDWSCDMYFDYTKEVQQMVHENAMKRDGEESPHSNTSTFVFSLPLEGRMEDDRMWAH